MDKSGNEPIIIRKLRRVFVEKIRALNVDLIKAIVDEYLTDAEIEAVLARRELLIKWIDTRIEKEGEGKVLYD